MVRPASEILRQLKKYPLLEQYIDATWVQSMAADPWMSAWHPFLGPDPTVIFDQLNTSIRILQEKNVAGFPDVARRLTANTWRNYLAARDELLQAAKLAKEVYVVRFVAPSKVPGIRTPDLEVDLPDGTVCVDCTAMNGRWQHDLLATYLRQELATVNSSYVLQIRASDDVLPFNQWDVKKLADDIRVHILGGPYPMGHTQTFSASKDDVRVDVDVEEVGLDDYAIETFDGFLDPYNDFTARFVKTLTDKADQMAQCAHRLVAMDLERETAAALLFSPATPSDIWEAVREKLVQAQLPGRIDGIAMTWGHGAGRVLDLTGWSRKPEAERLLILLARS